MPQVAPRPGVTGQGSEPPTKANPDPPIMPGDSSDVDPSTRIEQVGAMEPAILLDPVQQPPGYESFVSPAPLITTAVNSGPMGWTPPAEVPNGTVVVMDEGGDQYLVISRPWVRLGRPDGLVLSALFGDTVILSPENAVRGVETGGLRPLPV